jgi:hypothetical protein
MLLKVVSVSGFFRVTLRKCKGIFIVSHCLSIVSVLYNQRET